jgi:hypothetical protein
VTESGPIRVFSRDGRWLVDYGSYVCAYYAARSQAVEAGTEAARVEDRELRIDDAPVVGFTLPPVQACVDEANPADVEQMDDRVAYSEYVNGRLAAVSSQMLAYFLEGFDPVTATDADLARRTLLTNLARAERDRGARLTQHEEAQLDRLIAAQPPESRAMYTEVRTTSARHVLYTLRGLQLAKAAGTYIESPPLPSTG